MSWLWFLGFKEDDLMEKVEIGETGIQTTRIGLGTWAIGGKDWGGTDEKQSIKTVHAALDKGINLIDTAPAYGFGKSEEIIGKALNAYSNKRENVVLATKLGLNWARDGGLYRDSSKDRIKKEVEDSLKRLQTDYIDIYQIHWPDKEYDMQKSAEAMNDLYQEGKIRAIGVSNFTPEEMEVFRKVAPIHTNQVQLNMFQRHLSDWFKYSKDNDITTLTWGSLAHGLLTGKFSKNDTFATDDLRNSNVMFQGERFEQYINATEELKQFAKDRNKNIIQLSVRWLLDQPGVNVALWGARKPEQVDGVSAVSGWNLGTDELKEIDRIINQNVTDPAAENLAQYAPPLKSET